MLEDPCIIQMNIDRYQAILINRRPDEQRTRVEQLLAEAHEALAQAIARLPKTIAPEADASTVASIRR